jgi:hypothetical protein
MRTLLYITTHVLAWLSGIGRLALFAPRTADRPFFLPVAPFYSSSGKGSQRLNAFRLRLRSRPAPRCPARFYFGPYAHGPPQAEPQTEKRIRQLEARDASFPSRPLVFSLKASPKTSGGL